MLSVKQHPEREMASSLTTRRALCGMSVRFVHLRSFPFADGFAAGVQEAASRGVVHRNGALIAQYVDHGGN
jgi:hypothetical protein